MDLDEKFTVSQDERNLELQMFRERWKQELDGTNDTADRVPAAAVNQLTQTQTDGGPRTRYEIAAEIFEEGIKEERNGRLYEAVRLYRRAIQLDPDIEFKMEKSVDPKKKQQNRNRDRSTSRDDRHGGDIPEDLIEELLGFDVHENGVCVAENPIRASETHISMLPYEVIQYLAQWIVSSELDMMSLEQFAVVCRGFYKASRDDQIWRLACMRIWGILCGRPEDLRYSSWREMLIQRPQIRFGGLYISRISYIRPGEASFIDPNTHYQPWYNVHYYRFFRFFADGTVIYANTPDEPVLIVPRLRTKESIQVKDQSQVLSGQFCLSPDGETVGIFLKRDVFRDDGNQRSARNRRVKKKDGSETLTMELVIRNTREQLHKRLDWRRYSITRNIGKIESQSTVDVNQHFPSCYFSRVRSYSMTSEHPLM